MIAWSNIPSVQDVYDNVTYLQSLGKAQTAAVKRDAEIGVAQVGISTFETKNINQTVLKCSKTQN